MPQVNVTFYGHIRDVAPQGKLGLSLPAGSTVADLLRRLVEELGDPFRERAVDEYGQLLPSVKVIVAGEVVEMLEQPLGGQGAQVAVVIVPPVIGGSLEFWGTPPDPRQGAQPPGTPRAKSVGQSPGAHAGDSSRGVGG